MVAAGGVVAAAAAGGTWAAMTRPWSTGGPGPHGRRHARPSWTLALHADLGGPGAAVGRAQERGARLAVERHNSRADAAFRLLLRTADDAGDRARAARVAADLVADPSVVAVLGPSWDAAVAEVADVYGKGGVPLLVVSADPGALDLNALPLVCPTRPAGDLLALPLIHYLDSGGAVRRTAVVEDRTGGTPAWALERRLRAVPSAEGRMTVHRIGSGPTGAEEAARAAVAARAQGLVYTGTSPERAALLARALRREGFRGPRVAAQYAMEPGFLRGAGAAGTGWVFAAQFADPLALAGPGAREFVRAHRAEYGEDPGRWAVEAYDAVGLAATALAEVPGGGAAARASAVPADADGRDAPRSARAGNRTGAPGAPFGAHAAAPVGRVPVGVVALRRALGERLLRTSYQGAAKRLEFAAGSHRPSAASGSYLYRAEPGGYRFLGPYLQVGPGS
ncbi:ABC transporter substrate-binding protein [Streptomyces sp. NRRL S-87]|uniref:ABC transporter substrate-binding protein n=1 Tax=Streptomyces sp. NRRL S-87 TaxID=1463920 RepID=UPI00099BC83B|nr:ABC transporter substrate-binding protein [Streptomyces sp. NRRL S-87]